MGHGAFSVKRVMLFISILIFGVFLFGAGEVSAETCAEVAASSLKSGKGEHVTTASCTGIGTCTAKKLDGWQNLGPSSECTAGDVCCALIEVYSCQELGEVKLGEGKGNTVDCYGVKKECDDKKLTVLVGVTTCDGGSGVCCYDPKDTINDPKPTSTGAVKSGSATTLFNPLGSA